MLHSHETLDFINEKCFKDAYLPAEKRGIYHVIRPGLSKEDHIRLKRLDQDCLECNEEHWFANFLPDDERPDWVEKIEV